MLTIIKDTDLINDTEKYDIILVGTNTYLMLSNGFQRKIKYKYPKANELNMATKYGDYKKLGTICYTEHLKPTICFCYIANGYNFRPDKNIEFLDYASIEKCINEINNCFKGKTIATTVIGGSRFDGNGNHNMIMDILQKNNSNIDLYVYDYHQYSYKEEMNMEYIKTLFDPNFDKCNSKHWDDLNHRLKLILNPDGVKGKPFNSILHEIRNDIKKIIKE